MWAGVLCIRNTNYKLYVMFFLSQQIHHHLDQLAVTQDGSYSLHVLCLLASLLCSTEVLIEWHSCLLRLLCSGSWALVSLVYITSFTGILEYLLLFLHTILWSFSIELERMVGYLLAEYFSLSQVNSSRPAIACFFPKWIAVLQICVAHAGTEAMFADLGHFSAASIRVWRTVYMLVKKL